MLSSTSEGLIPITIITCFCSSNTYTYQMLFSVRGSAKEYSTYKNISYSAKSIISSILISCLNIESIHFTNILVEVGCRPNLPTDRIYGKSSICVFVPAQNLESDFSVDTQIWIRSLQTKILNSAIF